MTVLKKKTLPSCNKQFTICKFTWDVFRDFSEKLVLLNYAENFYQKSRKCTQCISHGSEGVERT